MKHATAVVCALLGIASLVLGGLLVVQLQNDDSATHATPPPVPERPESPDLPAEEQQSPQPPQLKSPWLTATAEKTGIPARALQSYVTAEAWAGREHPECGLGWTTLAGIGFVETAHGTIGGSAVDDAGVVRPEIFGPKLDGSVRGTAVITDTDGGRLDGDNEHDRAVGPMQFLPSVWDKMAVDANGDGKKDPHSYDDAAVTAAAYLCSERSITTPEEWTKAVFSYNPDEAYVNAVWQAANKAGTDAASGEQSGN